jgi:tetratricopeptide (TPR) repeat protein
LVRIAEREIAFQLPLQNQILRYNAETPADSVTRQQDLVLGVRRIQQREDGLNHLEEAIIAFRSSLEELPRDKLPLEWADTQHNFAMALARLGEQDEETEYLLEALSAVTFALEVWTYEDVPFNWAIAQDTLGWILMRLGERETERSISRFESAIAACQDALKVQTRDTLPLQCALTQNTLGVALHRLGEAQHDIVRLEESVNAYSSALEIFHSISAAKYVGDLENNLRIVQVLIQNHPNAAGGEAMPTG